MLFVTLEIKQKFDRTMIRTENFLMDGGIFDMILDFVGYYKIVNTPTDIPVAGLHPVTPPAVFIYGIRMKTPE